MQSSLFFNFALDYAIRKPQEIQGDWNRMRHSFGSFLMMLIYWVKVQYVPMLRAGP